MIYSELSAEEEQLLSNIQTRKHDLIFEISTLKDQLSVIEERIEIFEKEEEERRQKEEKEREELEKSASSSSDLKATDPEEIKKVIIQGKKKFNASHKKGIEFLVEKGLLEKTKESIANWLLDTEFFDKTAIGEYFGDNNPFNLEVLKEYVKLLDFTGLSFDKALRKFLSGFRLPGEAQKIDRIMEIFASRYHENNPGVFASPDTAYVLAFSVIMLNTDLHNPAVKNKITKIQFFKNNRGINNGGDLPEKFLSDIYDTIAREEIKMEETNNETSYTFFSPEREGYLVKQGGRVKTWKKRYFILTGNCLYYFKDQSDTTPCGIIPLENLEVRELEQGAGNKYRFELSANSDVKGAIKAAKTNSDGKIIEGRHNSYVFACETKDEKTDWMNSIKANMAKPPLYTLLQAKKDKVVNKAADDD